MSCHAVADTWKTVKELKVSDQISVRDDERLLDETDPIVLNEREQTKGIIGLNKVRNYIQHRLVIVESGGGEREADRFLERRFEQGGGEQFELIAAMPMYGDNIVVVSTTHLSSIMGTFYHYRDKLVTPLLSYDEHMRDVLPMIRLPGSLAGNFQISNVTAVPLSAPVYRLRIDVGNENFAMRYTCEFVKNTDGKWTAFNTDYVPIRLTNSR